MSELEYNIDDHSENTLDDAIEWDFGHNTIRVSTESQSNLDTIKTTETSNHLFNTKIKPALLQVLGYFINIFINTFLGSARIRLRYTRLYFGFNSFLRYYFY